MESDERTEHTRRVLSQFIDELLRVSKELDQTTQQLREAVVDNALGQTHERSESVEQQHRSRD